MRITNYLDFLADFDNFWSFVGKLWRAFWDIIPDIQGTFPITFFPFPTHVWHQKHPDFTPHPIGLHQSVSQFFHSISVVYLYIFMKIVQNMYHDNIYNFAKVNIDGKWFFMNCISNFLHLFWLFSLEDSLHKENYLFLI
jgi:uncharacterized membrane protein